MSKSRLLCIDFDGVLHKYDGTWGGEAAINGPAVPGAINTLRAYMDAGFSIAIYSTRSRSEKGRQAMYSWLLGQGMRVSQLHWSDILSPPLGYEIRSRQLTVRFPYTKPPAFCTLDDRNWPPWDGRFPTVQELQRFETWWERER